SQRFGEHRVRLENPMDGPVLTVPDGSPGAAGARKLGMARATSRGVSMEVLSALDPKVPGVYGELAAVPEAYSMLEGVQSEERRTAVSAQVAEIDPSADVKI